MVVSTSKFFFGISLLFLTLVAFSQTTINPNNIIIARDTFGVPHIFAKTDAEVAYGLAWTHSEDDFNNIQYNVMAGKGLLGSILGKDGVLFDFALQFLNIDSTVEARYPADITADFNRVLEGYVQGLNAYAAAHPKEVLLQKGFPVTAKEILKATVLQTSLMAGVGLALDAIKHQRISVYNQVTNVGSNALAIAPQKTEEGKTYLAINSHQPIEGRFAWYEAHLNSEEGWNIIGALFPGSCTTFIGSTPNLGWAHTVNYHSFGDIYEIEVNPKNKSQYKYDGQWRNFGKRVVKLNIKILGKLTIKAKRTVLLTEYGPTLKNKDGLYAIRFPAYENIAATNQWYKMNKAQNFSEFEAALKLQNIPMFNTVYADTEGNIYIHSGGIVPNRNPKLSWKQPIKGVSSAYKWTTFLPYEQLPTVLNPDCGFVYNCNQTPLYCAGQSCEWQGNFVGLQSFTYNRGERFKNLLENHKGKFTWNDFVRIKFDKYYDSNKNATYLSSFKNLYALNKDKYPDIADAIAKLENWNLESSADNSDAALALVTHEYLIKKIGLPFGLILINNNVIPEQDVVAAVRYAKKFLLKKHKTLDVPLGTVQRQIRGKVSLPASGMREVARAADVILYDKKLGIFKVTGGDGYIQLVKFSKEGSAEIQSINAYGASANENSPHYTDQMQLFQNEQFKTMTFNKDAILKAASKVYKPQ